MPPIASHIAAHSIFRCALRFTALSIASVSFSTMSQTAPAFASQVSTLAQLRTEAARPERRISQIHIEGVVLWADQQANKLVIKDRTAISELAVACRDLALEPGTKVLIAGECFPQIEGQIIRVNAEIVENDGLHIASERNGTVFLQAGAFPIVLDWFNAATRSLLSVEYAGPSLTRQKIPNSALLHPDPQNQEGPTGGGSGLEYWCFAGEWKRLPDFDHVHAVKSGIVSNFDIAVRSQEEFAGVRFSGLLKIPVEGRYTFWCTSDDGSGLRLGKVKCKALGKTDLPNPQLLTIATAQEEDLEYSWSQVVGRVISVRSSEGRTLLELKSGSGHITIEVSQRLTSSLNRLFQIPIVARGVAQPVYTISGLRTAGRLLVQNWNQIEQQEGASEPVKESSNRELLTSISEIKELSKEEASKNKPVRIRGVVTYAWPEPEPNLLMQDATSAIYVVGLLAGSLLPQIGDYWEIEGESIYGFAPNVRAVRARPLGRGMLPEPIKPSWDQLINGSLDAQYVEIEGVVTEAGRDRVVLLSPAGKISLQFPDLPAGQFDKSERAVVRIRGCVVPERDETNGQVNLGRIRLFNAAFSVLKPAPSDLFTATEKRISDLLHFDAQASAIQSVKIKGQILYCDAEMCILSDGSGGIRCNSKQRFQLHAGDLAEVVGFAEWSGVSVHLNDGVARKTGRTAFPRPKKLNERDLLRRENDCAPVQIEALLLNWARTGETELIEMQTGSRRFAARLDAANGTLKDLASGTKVLVSGVYLGHAVNLPQIAALDSFELLLNSASNLSVLTRPSWWNLKRAMMAVAVSFGVLALAAVWIHLLQQQIRQRTQQLEVEIYQRERSEQQRVIEQERTRVAHDLHDELGAGLTEISLLGSLARQEVLPAEKRKSYLDQVLATAGNLVNSLDEIVWAINPRYDTISSLASYYALYAQRFLQLASIKCRLEIEDDPHQTPLNSRSRHGLFLAFKEALNNVVRHSGASEVRLQIHLKDRELIVSVLDNGHGIGNEREEGMDGLIAMKQRMLAIGGKCSIESEPAIGTTVQFTLPYNPT
jgi:signal transduction histidine kinase